MPGTSEQRSQIRTERVGSGLVLRAGGAIDHDAVTVWDRCVSDVLDAHPREVSLDMSEVTFLASAGMRLIVDLRQQMRAAGIELTIANVPAKIGHLLELTGLVDAAAVEPTAD